MNCRFRLLPITLFLATAVMADCDMPAVPDSVPDGYRADRGRMLAAHRDLQGYQAAVENYLACLDRVDRLASAAEEEAVAREGRIASYNTVVAELVEFSYQMRAQLEAYNSRR